jgi:transcriptional regulator with GAF, ATPase, and Fis domain
VSSSGVRIHAVSPSASVDVERLLELTKALSSEQELGGALALVAHAALELLAAESTTVRMLDEHGRQLVSSARAGVGSDEAPVSYRPGRGLCAWVCDTGKSALVTDTKADARYIDGELGFAAGALIAVPLFAAGRAVGVLAASHRRPEAFDERQLALLKLIGNAATPALERNRVWHVQAMPQLEHALTSPLRLRLTAELLEVGDIGVSLEEAVVRSGRHRQDVEACFRPMIRWLIVEHDGARYRLRPGLPAEVRALIREVVDRHADQIGRERHVRHHLMGGMIGLDPKMQMVFGLVRQVARIDVSVLITGETGTGKELVARSIHDISPRCKQFFGAVNCATLTETLFESQVFGHVRGAFTGAVNDYVGLVERCNGGTLFLDEVGDLSLTNQVKLLRFLQESTFNRLGETKQRRSDFRLISATNRDLESMVSNGTFREDLYYRLQVFPIRLPSLRERKGDLKYLVDGILAMQAQRFRTTGGPPTITPEALAQLERYNWPGNVRELENVMARAVVMAGGGPIRSEHLPEVELLSDAPPNSTIPPDDLAEMKAQRTLAEVQRDHIEKVLRAQRGNIKASAEILGISRTTLYKKIRDYEIDAPV